MLFLYRAITIPNHEKGNGMRKTTLWVAILVAAILTAMNASVVTAQSGAAATQASIIEIIDKLPTMTPSQKIVSLMGFYDVMKLPDDKVDGAAKAEATRGEMLV